MSKEPLPVQIYDCVFNSSNEDVKEIAKAMFVLAEGLRFLAQQVDKPQYGVYIEGNQSK